MINRRTHYFAQGPVITGILPSGEYGAYRENEDEGRVRGFGHSRLAAIADLNEAIGDTEEEEVAIVAAFRADHLRDLRKHEVADV